MKLNEVKYKLLVDGMTCNGCEVKIERKLKQIIGIISVNADYSNNLVTVIFDNSQINLREIQKAIIKLDYAIVGSTQIQDSKDVTQSHSDIGFRTKNVKEKNLTKNASSKSEIFNITDFLLIVASIYAISMILKRFRVFEIFNNFPEASQGASYTILFLIGVMTSVHCIAMCGGINLSQCVNSNINGSVNKMAMMKPSFLYNSGRVVSYTIIGGIVGALGSVMSFSPFMKGMIAFVAGMFMILMGLNMLNIFPWLKKFSLRMPKIFINKLDTGKNNSSFYVGLLNGFMPCGPLQSMQLFALSTGNPIKGALSMFFFSMGTFLLMFLLGALSSLLTKKFTSKMMSISSVLVIFMGIFMFNNGIGLAGLSLPTFSMMKSNDSSNNSKVSAIVNEDSKVQTVSFDLTTTSYEPITVKAGIPVKWIINADASQITGCNNEVIVPKYNISKKLVPGENIIEFTPEEVGTIPYSCWMGMIRSSITVE